MKLERELKDQHKLTASVRLRPSGEAKTLRNLRNGKRKLAAGPYLDTEKVIGGYYVLECASLEQALKLADRMPNYGHGSIEPRPFWQ